MGKLAKLRAAPPPSSLFLPATLAFIVVGVGVVGVTLAASSNQTFLALGGASLVLMIALAVLMAEEHLRLSGMVATDALTGLINHRGFHEVLAAAVRRAGREQGRVALVTLDLDDFKLLNDSHGHPYGDEVLRGVGRKLRDVVRSADMAARVGGEEFALILPDTDADGARRVAERARLAIGLVPIHGPPLSCSAGVAIHPDDADRPSTLVQLADAALYAAKRAGKACTVHYDAGVERVLREDRDELAELIAGPPAIEASYQPILSLATGQVVAHEALAHFPHAPLREPGHWFALARQAGAGADLEAAVVGVALGSAGRPGAGLLAIQASGPALAAVQLRQAPDGDLGGLIVEVLEHEPSDDDGLAEALAELRLRGALIAVDDGGAGYAGYRRLAELRPDIVRLRHELIHDVHADRARRALVGSFVAFARETGAVVWATGIETRDVATVLVELGVDWGEGHVPAGAATRAAAVSEHPGH